MNEHIVTIIVALIGVGSSAGFWAWMQKKSQIASDQLAAEKSERNEFRESLKAQVDRLQGQVDMLIKDKEDLLREVSDLKERLATATATISHLEETLRHK